VSLVLQEAAATLLAESTTRALVRAAQAAGFAIDGGARYRESAPPGVRVTITTMGAREAETLAAALANYASRRALIHARP
jgi:hypothetical protein